MGIIDEAAFLKKGTHSAGVARQWHDHEGSIERRGEVHTALQLLDAVLPSLPPTDRARIEAAWQQACGRMEDEILELMGKTVRAVGYDPDLWIDDGPLAGWGSVPVDHLRMVNRLRTNCDELVPESTLDRIEMNWLHHGPPAAYAICTPLLGSRLTESQLARVEANCYTHNAPDDVLERLVAVMTNPATWLDLLVKTSYHETDGDVPEVRDTLPPQGGW